VAADQPQAQFVTVARLVRTHGRHGELAADLDTDDPEWFALLPAVYLWDGGSRRREARVSGVRPHGRRLLLRFAGIDSLSDAEQVAGWQVQIPAESRPAAPAGRFYLGDLMGCEVSELDGGKTLGRVTGWMETGAVPLLEVGRTDKVILIPFAASICVEVDLAARAIRVRLPEGLDELNRNS